MKTHNISISENEIWASDGTYDIYGTIECCAVLSAAPAESQSGVYEELQDAVDLAIEEGRDTARVQIGEYAYAIRITAIISGDEMHNGQKPRMTPRMGSSTSS